MIAQMVKARLNGEFDIILPKHRADRPEWYTEAGWERQRLAALRSEIIRQRSGGIEPVVYYVGAEEGEMPALCQMWGAKVVMFEPNPLVLPNVKAIWEANKLEKPHALFVGFASNVTEANPEHLNPLAVGFAKDWPEAANGEIIGNHGFKELYQEADAFPQIRLDDMPDGVLPPTIISFDCEGSEWQVMKGAERIMRELHPTIFASISPEFMFHQWGQYSRDFRNWLIDMGYKETLLDYQHELHCLYEPKGVV
jgi:FkbM family methyltransferase